MIEDAEARGAISPGQTILEPTSGNTGISLAMICQKGYPLKVVMPENVTEERTQLLRMYGAEIVYSPGEQGSNGAVAMALEIAEAESSYYMPYQYGNEANPRAHYDGTAVEILEELDDVAAFVGATVAATDWARSWPCTTCSRERIRRPSSNSIGRWRWRCATARTPGCNGSTRSWPVAT